MKKILAISIIVLAIIGAIIYYLHKTPKEEIVENNSPNVLVDLVSGQKEKGQINSTTFNCAEKKNIQAIFFNDKVELTLSDGRKELLPQAISASGARYTNTDESFVFWNKGNSAFITEGASTTFNNCFEQNLNADIYPLYSNLSWGEEVATTSNEFGLSLTGFQVNSENISDSTYYKFDKSFVKYYEDKLVGAGWTRSKDYEADGAGSSIWTYTKGKKIIILSYNSQEIKELPDQPFTCPCNMTFSIFTGEIN